MRSRNISYDNSKTILSIGGAVVGGLFILILATALKPFAIVNAGTRGVVMKFGKVQDVILDEGIHPIMPIVTTIKSLSVRVQKNDIPAAAASKDLQDVKINVALNWSIDPTRVNEVFQQIGDEQQIVLRIINPAVAEVVKAATAKKNAEEIITKRTELKQEIDNQIKERLAPYGLLVQDISLVDVTFSPEFAKAIEAKQIAEQEAKRAEFIAQKATQEAQAEINRAKGQAEAQRLVRQTITPELLQKQAIEKWDGRFPTVMTGNGTLPFINVTPPARSSKK
ncbi:MAG: prohibitin family protein [Hormoscilla sp. SP12CHS1]|nr:prohibitin family protein [Hormoscilla sp. SP12CHS1]